MIFEALETISEASKTLDARIKIFLRVARAVFLWDEGDGPGMRGSGTRSAGGWLRGSLFPNRAAYARGPSCRLPRSQRGSCRGLSRLRGSSPYDSPCVAIATTPRHLGNVGHPKNG